MLSGCTGTQLAYEPIYEADDAIGVQRVIGEKKNEIIVEP